MGEVRRVGNVARAGTGLETRGGAQCAVHEVCLCVSNVVQIFVSLKQMLEISYGQQNIIGVEFENTGLYPSNHSFSLFLSVAGGCSQSQLALG